MLPDRLFHPLDLDDLLEDAIDKGDDAVIDLLESALTDPRARGDERIEEYHDPLVGACRSAGRQRDGIDILHRLAKREPHLTSGLLTDIAALHGEIGEDLLAAGLLRQGWAEQRARPEADRDLHFYGTAAMVAADLAGAEELAHSLASEGLELALNRGDTASVLMLAMTRSGLAPTTSGRPEDALAARADRHLRAVSADLRSHQRTLRQPSQRVELRMAYLPEPEYATARARGLLDATLHPRHEDYRREIQDSLEQSTAHNPGASAYIVAIDVEGLLAYAEREGLDPASRRTRLSYNDSLAADRRGTPWPPPRNAACWCGAGRKYKKCCGAPGFARVAAPDPASLILKVELDGVEPPVWRRIAAPSNLPLDRLHRLIQSAMGWGDEHAYEFDNGEATVADPRLEQPGPQADSERVISMATEAGEQFTYLYDFGDGWSHTITLQEIRAAGEDNVPEVLDGAGACPPEDCGGPAGYLELVAALSDPADPRHDEAVELLGRDFDPATFRPVIPAGRRDPGT